MMAAVKATDSAAARWEAVRAMDSVAGDWATARATRPVAVAAVVVEVAAAVADAVNVVQVAESAMVMQARAARAGALRVVDSVVVVPTVVQDTTDGCHQYQTLRTTRTRRLSCTKPGRRGAGQWLESALTASKQKVPPGRAAPGDSKSHAEERYILEQYHHGAPPLHLRRMHRVRWVVPSGAVLSGHSH